MAQNHGFGRRAFLKSAGLTALAGAVGAGSVAEAAGGAFQMGGGKFDFDTPYNRLGTDSVKWDAALKAIKLSGGDGITAGMGVADMDFKCAPAITKALMDRVQHENWGYGGAGADFRDSIINWNKTRYNITVNPDLMDITTGVHPGLIAALKAFCPKGSKVLLMPPTYGGFYGDLRATGTLPEEVPLKEVNGRFEMDFAELERHISRDTNAIILCNPNNPTGNHWSRQDLNTLGEICLKRRVVVLADEIHRDFVTKGNTFTPFSTLENRAVVDNSITFSAASKSFCLAAMKCAYYFTTNPSYFAGVKAQNRADLSTLGQIATKAAYQGGADWMTQCNEYIDGNQDFVQKYIKANIPMVKVGEKPQGTYLVWIDVSQIADKIGAKQLAAEANKNRQPGMPGDPTTPEQMVEKWIEKNAGLQLGAGSGFGIGGANHMRMNIATSRATLEKALASLSNALKRGTAPTAAAI